MARGERHAIPPACAAVSSFLVQKSRILLEGCPAGMFQPILPQPWRLVLRLAGYRERLGGNSRRHDSDFNLEAEPDPDLESDLSSADRIVISQ